MMEYHVYMLRCSDGKFYVGVTADIAHRIDEHQNGKHKTAFTYTRRPVTLVYSALFQDIWEAIHWEKTLKPWSKKKKEALIQNNEALLKLHAKKSFPRRYKRTCASLRSLYERSTRHDIYCILCTFHH